MNRYLHPSQRGRVEAADFVQDAVCDLVRLARAGSARVRLDDGRSAFGLVVKVARWRLHRDFERHARERSARGSATLDDVPMPPVPASPGDLIALRARLEALGRTEHLRSVVRLRMEGYTVAEIARRTGRSPQSIDQFLRRLEAHPEIRAIRRRSRDAEVTA